MINGGDSFILAHRSTPKIRTATGAVPVNDDPALLRVAIGGQLTLLFWRRRQRRLVLPQRVRDLI